MTLDYHERSGVLLDDVFHGGRTHREALTERREQPMQLLRRPHRTGAAAPGRAIAIVALILAVGVVGCVKPDAAGTAPTPDLAAEPPRVERPPAQRQDPEPLQAGVWNDATPGGETLGLADLAEDGILQTIYFDYDQSEIRPDQRVKLEANAQLLRASAHSRVLIAGHSDERGTREYNMALGERRASATMQYLTSLGVAPDRIEIVSYGEEDPAVVGSSESSWAQNRRAELRPIEGIRR